MIKIVPACAILLALTAAAAAQTPNGGEFRINTYTTSNQAFPRTAMEPDGDFVVVWTSDVQDGSGDGVFGQRFAASGAPRGSEFQINTYTTGSQNQPAVAVGSNGDFVVVWSSGEVGSFQSIQGRRFDASGSAIGAEFMVNAPFRPGSEYMPRVGRAADGRFVVVWTSETAEGCSPIPGGGDVVCIRGIAARRFDASGDPIGSEFLVNTFTIHHQIFGDVAVEANGNFVAAWEDNYRGDIFGQRYDASGNRLGSEFRVNSYTTGRQGIPSVSVSPAGGFVVAWISSGDGSGFGVFGRRFDASGNAVGSDFVVNTYTTGPQYGYSGQVAHDAGGNFVVTWMSGGQDGSAYGSFAQRFNASGARRGAEFRVNTFTTNNQMVPSVASDSVGNFVVVWESGGQDGDGSGVFAQRFGDLIFEDGFDGGALSP